MAKKQTSGKDPAVLFYTQDFIVGTYSWTNEQKGKYITLLCLQHQKLNKLTLSEIQFIAEGDELVLEKFPLQEDGYYSNTRLAMEIENRKVRTDSSRANGLLGGRPSKTQDKPMGYSKVNLKETYNKPTINPIENANENENDLVDDLEIDLVNEDVIESNTDLGELNILKRLLDDLIQYEDIDKYKLSNLEISEYGGLDKVFDRLQFDDSQKTNWSNRINNVKLMYQV